MILIGVVGKAHSGKDEVAKHLFAQHAFTRIALADPLKLAAQQMFGLTQKQTWDPDYKEVVIPFWGMSPRTMFQLLGTEASKPVFGDDVWCKRWELSYALLKDTDNIICTDIRFDVEAGMIRANGGVIIELQRGVAGLEGGNATHISEAGLTLPPDFIIDNNHTLAELYAAVDYIVEVLG